MKRNKMVFQPKGKPTAGTKWVTVTTHHEEKKPKTVKEEPMKRSKMVFKPKGTPTAGTTRAVVTVHVTMHEIKPKAVKATVTEYPFGTSSRRGRLDK